MEPSYPLHTKREERGTLATLTIVDQYDVLPTVGNPRGQTQTSCLFLCEQRRLHRERLRLDIVWPRPLATLRYRLFAVYFFENEVKRKMNQPPPYPSFPPPQQHAPLPRAPAAAPTRLMRPPFVDTQTNIMYDVNDPEYEGWLTKQSTWLKVCRHLFARTAAPKGFTTEIPLPDHSKLHENDLEKISLGLPLLDTVSTTTYVSIGMASTILYSQREQAFLL